MNRSLQGTGYNFLYYFFSAINPNVFHYSSISQSYTSDYPPTYKHHLKIYFTGLFEVYLYNDQPHILMKEYKTNSQLMNSTLYRITCQKSTTYSYDALFDYIYYRYKLPERIQNILKNNVLWMTLLGWFEDQNQLV